MRECGSPLRERTKNQARYIRLPCSKDFFFYGRPILLLKRILKGVKPALFFRKIPTGKPPKSLWGWHKCGKSQHRMAFPQLCRQAGHRTEKNSSRNRACSRARSSTCLERPFEHALHNGCHTRNASLEACHTSRTPQRVSHDVGSPSIVRCLLM